MTAIGRGLPIALHNELAAIRVVPTATRNSSSDGHVPKGDIRCETLLRKVALREAWRRWIYEEETGVGNPASAGFLFAQLVSLAFRPALSATLRLRGACLVQR